MAAVRTSRVVLHAMWLTTLIALPVLLAVMLVSTLLGQSADRGHDWAGGVGFLILLTPLWAPAVALAGAAIGLVAAVAARSTARVGPWLQSGAASLAGGAVGLAAALATHPESWAAIGPFDVAGIVAGAAGGGLAVLFAGRSPGEPGAGVGWGAAAAVLVAATGVGTTWLGLASSHWDAAEDCAQQLGVGESVVAVAERSFPPQSWCISEYAAEPSAPTWAAPALVLILTAAAVCALAATRRWWRPVAMVIATLAIVAAGTGWAIRLLDPGPAADVLAGTREELRSRPAPSRPAQTTGPAPASPPTPTSASEVSVGGARSTVARLAQVASTTGRSALWLRSLATSEAPCELASGGTGVEVTLVGRFTVRDPGQVHGPAEMAELSAANEQLAGRIVNAWVATGLLTAGDVVHGEWWLGRPTGSPVESAHVGFTAGTGELRVVSFCSQP